jgi:hypothetical protein
VGHDEAVMTATYPPMPTVNPAVSAQDGDDTEVALRTRDGAHGGRTQIGRHPGVKTCRSTVSRPYSLEHGRDGGDDRGLTR